MQRAKRIALVTVSALLTLALLLGGQWLYQEQFRRQPLQEALLRVPGVEEASVREEPGAPLIAVRLGRVNNLQETYAELETVAREAGYREFRLELSGRPDQLLEESWRAAQFPVYQAAARGDFITMAGELEQISRERGLSSWSVSVDERNIYLQMENGDHYLYRVVGLRLPALAYPGGEGKA